MSAGIILFFFQTPKQAVPEQAPVMEKIRQMDFPGIALVMGGTISYILAVQYGGVTEAWNSSVVVGLLVGFVAMFAAWGALQWWQGERSMIPPRLAKHRLNYVMMAFAFVFVGGYFAAIYFIPIYFQSVHNTSPTTSGVRNLPMILAVTFGTIASGAIVSMTGYYQHLLIGGGVLATIGSGLLYLLDTDSSTGEWIGYQILAGAGWGIAFQIPMIAVQGTVDPKDLSTATGMLLCTFSPPPRTILIITNSPPVFQGLGGAFVVSGAQAAFINQMALDVLRSAPDLNISREALVMTGATEIRNVFTPEQQPFVIDGYMAGVKVVFAMCIATTGLATLVAMGTKWQRLSQEKRGMGGAA